MRIPPFDTDRLFSAWTRQRPALATDTLRLLAVTPLEHADMTLARAVLRHGGTVAVDIGRRNQDWAGTLAATAAAASPNLGLRLPDGCGFSADMLPAATGFVVMAASDELAAFVARVPVVAEVCSVAEAEVAIAAGACGLITRGQECGGRIGDESSFILLQRVLALAEEKNVPVWAQGGMGPHAAAAAVAGGAFGVVLESQLALLAESTLADDIRRVLAAMDGSETRVISGYQVFCRPGTVAAECGELSATDVRARLGASLAGLLPAGQDAALARLVADHHANVEAALHGYRMSISGHLHQAVALESLAENSPLARTHGTRYPIAQGPMTRVSDTAEFASAVAANGALPFLALSLMNAQACRTLIEETRAQIGAQPWGIGVLGFAPPEVLEPQLELVREFRPSALLLAGGRPSQARAFTDMGIPAYLHVPSPGLLELFLRDGARHFVFEGRECGGHVGPRFSFVLWEQQLDTLLRFERAEELHVLFAGGIHDERSAAMVAAMAAPLAARGARIGVLMGTAYITTEEAVRCGAVVPAFQEAALAGAGTALVESAPGHAIRCLPSDFVEFFNSEKSRLQAQGLEAQDIWQRLEDLNIGRLRVASKGVERRGDTLVHVDDATQRAEGMYMIGQLIALQDGVQPIAALHDRVSRGATAFLGNCRIPALPRPPHAEPVAVVGMACLYPGSPDLHSYWANILAGRDLVGEVPAERWNSGLYYDNGTPAPGKTVSKWGGFIDPVAFDPLQYGIPPQSLAAIEPVQLLSLDIARRALADAGYEALEGKGGRRFDRDKTAVIFGAESGTDLANAYAFRNMYTQYLGTMPAELDAVLPRLTEDSFPGILVNVIAGRIANRLGLGGVNYSVDSACASSLTAVELAVKELRSGSSDMVLAGGADFHNTINDFMMFTSVGALSPSGRCRSFDASADGICLGEGVGVVVLKRLADAERDGDRIYAVIEGAAGSSDGRGLGLTAPRKEGQKRALERAYLQAGVLPAEVGLVEAHGTGTVVGDGTELRTLEEVYNAGGALPARTGLGSVKSQIGHTKCAAGIAGLIKVSMALHHRVLAPTAQVTQPNAGYRGGCSPFMLNRTAQPWVRGGTRAAVSAFGFGGANFHAVLAAHGTQWPASGLAQWPAELFLFHAADAGAARQAAARLATFLQQAETTPALRDLAFTVSTDSNAPVQFALVAGNVAELCERLDAIVHEREHPQVQARCGEPGKLAFVFPGQGSQQPGMLGDLFVAFPWLNDILALARPEHVAALFPPTAYSDAERDAQQAALTDTRVAQPALGLVESAAAELLARLGIRPDMAAGHSYGELAALASAGAISRADLIRLSTRRGEAILAAVAGDPGRMAAVNLGARELAPLLAGLPAVVLANQNSPQQTVISGPSADIDAALVLLRQQGIGAKAIATACAFHSPVVAAASASFAQVLEEVAFSAPAWPVYSNVTAEAHADDAATMRDLLARHVASPVRFVEEIERMHDAGARVFVEVGPKRVLGGCIAKILAGRPHTVIAIDDGRTDALGGLTAFLKALAALAVHVGHLDTAILFAGRGAQPVDLAAPPQVARTSWMVNGARAWPHQGALPAHAGRIVTEPVALPYGQAAAPVANAAVADTAVINYLDNMREVVRAQRDVLLGLLGAPSAAPAPRVERVVATQPAPMTATPAVASVAETAVAEAANGSAHDTLVAIVSERTGYPADMLDLDLDLEADLSIDSIKRLEIIGELAERLAFRAQLGADSDALLEQLAARKNLRSMLDWLTEKLPAATTAPAPAPVPAAATAAPVQDLQAVLLAIVSARTGYPEDVLEPDLDLEADLSIDSIKRLEIVGELAEKIGLDSLLADKDKALEALASRKTLRAMVEWLQTRLAPAAATAPADEEDPLGLARYVLRTVEAPRVIPGRNRFHGKRFLLTDDSLGVAARLATRLETHGASVRLINFTESEPLPAQLDCVDGIVHLWSLNPANRVRDVKRFFTLVREVFQHQARHILVASGLGGNFGCYRADGGVLSADFGQGAGLAGMIKSLAKEFPEVRAHWVDLDLSEPADDLAACLEMELLAENDITEVAYQTGQRRCLQVVRSELSLLEGMDNLELDEDSVVLLTGGARGITARIATALARRYRCHFELVGRSAAPDAAEEDASTRQARDLRSLRQAVIAAHPGMRPAEVEKRCAQIQAERDMRDTFAQIRAAGGSVTYTQLDVRDIDAFAELIRVLYEKHGRIDGVVHGAGVVEDKLVRHKSSESFQRVFDTKVRGALMLYKLIRDDVKFVVFFSSVAGAFGNRGQIDYASANDVLDKLAHALQARVQGRVLSVNWGPWADTGMVSAELEREYARKGIGLIPLNDGVEALLRELSYGRKEDTQVVLMCGTPDSFGAPASLFA